MDFLSVLTTVAPSIATAFGGPLAGTAVAAIENALGINPPANASLDQRKSTIEDKIVSATPEDLLKLKEADNAHAEAMAKLGYDNIASIAALNEKQDELTIADRASARDREKTVRDKIPASLAVFVTLGFFGILAYMLTSIIPPANKDVLNIMLGSLGTAWISIIAYYFGSSAGSDRKTELMANSNAGGSDGLKNDS